MRVIHGLWLRGGRLALWGEDSTLVAPVARRPGRAPRERPHPFAAGHAALAEVLDEVAAKAATSTALLTLPTRAGVPLDSPELVRADGAEPVRGNLTLAGWRVPTLEYDADHALPVLLALADDPTVVRGGTLRLVEELAGFAADLVDRGRTLPGVVTGRRESGGTATAVWRPLLTGADAGRVRALAMALPPAARAAEPALSVAALVADALDALTDAAVRTALEGVRLIDSRATGVSVGVRAWLRALTGRQRGFTIAPDALGDLVDGLADWQRDAAGSPVRACFRLVEPRRRRRSSMPSRPTGSGSRWTQAAAGGSSSRSSRPRSRAWSSARTGSGRPGAACGRSPGISTRRRRRCWRSWAGPAGSGRS